MIVKTDCECETDGALHSTSIVQVAGLLHYMGGRNPATPGCCCMLEYEQLLSSIRLLCRCWWCHLLCRIIATSWPQQLPACCDHGRLCGQIKLSPKRMAPQKQAFISYISSIVIAEERIVNENKIVSLATIPRNAGLLVACAPAPAPYIDPGPWC